MAPLNFRMPQRARTASALAVYRKKRDFNTTPEPAGQRRQLARTAQRLFCIQKHAARRLHYDFRLEHNGLLLSWAIPKGPSLRPTDKRLAVRVEDHPREYADFEGVIREGYGAGVVLLWDKGFWRPETSNVTAALAKGELKFSLDGVKLKGSWVLVRTSGQNQWLLIKHRDDWAGDIDVAEVAPLSVKSNRDLEQILAETTLAEKKTPQGRRHR